MNNTEQRVRPDAGFKPGRFERLEEFLSLHWRAVVVGWVCTAAVSLAGYSSQKPLWNDEIYSRFIAMEPSLARIWAALLTGFNNDPPVGHVVVHTLVSVFGPEPLVLRLHAILGVSALMVFLAVTMKRQIGPLYSLLALFLPFCTTIRNYGYEGRPYGLMYGCIGAAIYCWVRAGEDEKHSGRWNLGLGFALAAALGCQYYGVFMLPAFVLGEAVRSRRRGHISWAAIAALAAPSATLLCYLPLMKASSKLSGAYFGRPTLSSLPNMLGNSLNELEIPLLVFLLVVVMFPAVLRFRLTADNEGDNPYLTETGALAFGLTLVPVMGWLAGEFVLHAFQDRYVLHGVIGICMLIPLCVTQMFRYERRLGVTLVLVIGSWALFRAAVGVERITHSVPQNEDFARLVAELPKLKGDIVVSSPHVLPPLVIYSPELKKRCLVLLDGAKDLQFTGQNTGTLNSADGNKLGYFRAEEWNQYSREHPSFLFLTVHDGDTDYPGWLRDYLRSVNRYGRVVENFGQYVLVEAKPPLAQPE